MKRFTAIILCAVLIFFSPSAAYASSAGSVVVTGGSIASGGLSGGYSGKSESAAVTLTMALMYSLGITVKLSQDAIDAGQTAYSYVKSKFYEWVGGSSAEQMTDSQREDLKSRFSVINGGSNVGPDGKIYFNGTALDLIRRFLNWLKGNNYINNDTGGGSQETVEVNGIQTLYTDSSPVFYHNISTNNRYTQFNFDKKVAFVQYLNTSPVTQYYLSFYSNEPFTGVATFYKVPETISTRNISSERNPINGYYYTTYVFRPSDEWEGVGFIPNLIEVWLAGLDGNFNPDSGSGSQGDEGFNYEGDFDPDTLNNPDGKQTVVNPPVIDPMEQQNPNANAQIGVENYLELLKQLLNKYTNPQAVADPVPAQDLPTLSPIELPVPDNLPVAWPVDLPSSPTAPEDIPQDSTPVVDPAQPADPDISIPEMSAHLEDYFPFCLPFDVYKIMQKFNGSPQAPQIHLSFDAPGLNLHIPLDLDFSVFDSVAAVLRNGEAVLYVVGLAVVTRKTFLRS